MGEQRSSDPPMPKSRNTTKRQRGLSELLLVVTALRPDLLGIRFVLINTDQELMNPSLTYAGALQTTLFSLRTLE